MIRAADLFAGAGGASTGLRLACQQLGAPLDLVAVNHWPIAVETHSRNHPEVRHFCAPVESLDPRVAVPGGKLDLLIAAPECTHHSTARGGKPINDQSRASAWHILRWLELLRVDAVLIENVPEFRTWGPLGAHGRPLKSKKGVIFEQFLKALEGYGFTVEYRILNAADYGEATTRRRLFIQARRKGGVTWPEPTHSRSGAKSLLRGTRHWRAAREVIDWTIQGESIFSRKKPLAPTTMRRIVEGLKRFGGPELQPFIVAFYSEKQGESARGRSLNEPLPTITGSPRFGVAQPFLVPFKSERDGQRTRVHSVDDPVPTVTAGATGFGLVEPFVVELSGTGPDNLPRSARSVDAPLGTIRASGTHHALVEPFLLGQHGGATARPVSEPAPTVTTDGAIALIEPYLTQYYGSGSGLLPRSVQEPMPTVTAKDRFALVEPRLNGQTLDIRFRMLRPHELAAAMGFPADYAFAGTKTDQVKQIGNAISVRTMAALCRDILAVKVATRSPWKREATA